MMTKHVNEEIITKLFDIKENVEIEFEVQNVEFKNVEFKKPSINMQRPKFKKDIENYKEAYKILDGLEVELTTYGKEIIITDWKKEDEDIIKEFYFLISKDSFFGCFVEDKNGFEEQWLEDKSILQFTDQKIFFTNDMFEIITKMEYNFDNKKWEE